MFFKRNKIYACDMYHLDRSRICPLDEDTPAVVLVEISNAHSITPPSVERLRDRKVARSLARTILESATYRIDRNLNDRTRILAKRWLGIRDDENVSDSFLVSVLDRWELWIQKPPGVGYLIESIGSPSVTFPNSLNSCFLYGICIRHGIKVEPMVTLGKLGLLASLALKESGSMEVINTFLRKGSHEEMLNLVSTIPDDHISYFINIPISTVEEYILPDYKEILKASNRLRGKVSPKNHIEAIIVSIRDRGISILDAKDPLRWYQTGDDPNIEVLNRKNSRLITGYDHRIPIEVYKPPQIHAMSVQEGYTQSDQISREEYLRYLGIIETFHYGWQRTTKNEITPFTFEPLDSCDPKTLISYGLIGESVVTVTVEEMIAMFRATKNRNMITGKGNFTEESLKRLQYMYRHENELFLELEYLKIYRDGTKGVIDTSFDGLERKGSTVDRDNVVFFFKHIFTLAMYMRGWVESQAYPIEVSLVENMNEVYIKVTESISKLEIMVKEFGSLGEELMMLPIFRYTEGEYIQGDGDNGVSIQDRLGMVKSGTSTSGCIRLSSNWFAATAYYYLILLKVDPGFDISRLRNIA